MAVSNHFDGNRFFNATENIDKSFFDVLKWKLTTQASPWPEWVENVAQPTLPARLPPGQAAVTYIGHAALLVQFAGLNWLTDPVFSDRVSPVGFAGPKRVRAPGVPFGSLPEIHLITISHSHYDHLDRPSLIQLAQRYPGAHWVVPLNNQRHLEFVPKGQLHELDWWQSYSINDAQVTLTPVQHWSARTPWDHNESLWGGFFVSAGGVKVYHSGDTGYAIHFRHTREKLGAPDVALLPIGAYEPRWFMRSQHMNPDDAVRAHLDLGAKKSIGMHFATFQLTDEAIDAPVRALKIAREEHQLDEANFVAPEVGETIPVKVSR